MNTAKKGGAISKGVARQTTSSLHYISTNEISKQNQKNNNNELLFQCKYVYITRMENRRAFIRAFRRLRFDCVTCTEIRQFPFWKIMIWRANKSYWFENERLVTFAYNGRVDSGASLAEKIKKNMKHSYNYAILNCSAFELKRSFFYCWFSARSSRSDKTEKEK
jgi:hypothetical protein